MIVTVNPLQPLKIINESDLNRNLIWSLTHLYQPIMGSLALSVYMTLSSLERPQEDQQVTRHNQLQQLINIGIQEFNQARKKLESLYLISTYRDRESHPNDNHQLIIYEIHQPLTFLSFLNQPLLNTALYNQLGDKDYQDLIDCLPKNKLNDPRFEKLNSNFPQAFYSIDLNKHEEKIYKPLSEPPIEVSYTGNFNYSQFLSYLMADGINHSLLTERLKNQVYALHQIYQYNESQLAQIIFQSISPNGKDLDHQLIQQLAEKKASQSRNTKPSNEEKANFPILLKEAEVEVRKKMLQDQYPQLSRGDINLILSCEQIPNGSFLYKIKHGKNGFVANNEAKYLENLLKVTTLHPAIINFLIYYLINIEKKPTLFNGDLQRYANEWQQMGIKDVASAILYVQQQDNNKPFQKNKGQKQGYSEAIPEWMEEGPASKEEKPQEEVTSNHQLEINEKALREKLDNLFRGEA